MTVAADRTFDVITGSTVASFAGFFPLDLETWVVVMMGASSICYYLTGIYLKFKDRKKDDED